MLVRDLMSPAVHTFHPGTPLRDAASVLVVKGISGAPVCDAEGHVLGVLSESDILFKEHGVDADRGRLLGWLSEAMAGDLLAKQAARSVGEAMTSPAITIRPGATVAAAARAMTNERVNRLPVVDGERLVGIITRADLVRAFTRSDEEIQKELEDVIARQLWIPLEYVQLEVERGLVHVTGTVDTRTEAELVTAFATRVPGVVDVLSELDWREDDLKRRTRVPDLPRRV
jgi:CBS domain-containing protein